MHMVYHLMCYPSIVLKNIVVFQTLCDGDFLRYGKDLGELVIGNVVEFRAMVLGDDELLHGSQYI